MRGRGVIAMSRESATHHDFKAHVVFVFYVTRHANCLEAGPRGKFSGPTSAPEEYIRSD